jgi:hypothetical protein
MKSRRRYITEPGDRHWLYASPWIAAAGGLVVVILLAAMALLQPGSPTAGDGRSQAQAATAAPRSPAAAPDAPVRTLPPVAPDAESYATPGTMPPTF